MTEMMEMFKVAIIIALYVFIYLFKNVLYTHLWPFTLS